MIRVFFSDSISKQYPRAAKAILSCDKDRPVEILGILESLMKQTGLNPEDKMSLGYLRRALSMGLLRIIQSGFPVETEENKQEESPKPEKVPKERSFGTLGDAFGQYMP